MNYITQMLINARIRTTSSHLLCFVPKCLIFFIQNPIPMSISFLNQEVLWSMTVMVDWDLLYCDKGIFIVDRYGGLNYIGSR